jgi:hypothetical protein
MANGKTGAREIAATLMRSIETTTVATIGYTNELGEASTRRILPYGVLYKPQRGVVLVQAFDGLRNGIITFRLDRISAIELDAEPLGEVQAAWKKLLGAIGLVATDGHPVVFPGPETPTFRGKLAQPTVANGGLPKYLAKGWQTRPYVGAIVEKSRSLL